VSAKQLQKDARAWLNETWLEMRNGNAYPRRAYFAGAADMLADIGLITDEERDDWIARRDQCPGHDDEGEGGRDWCAYGCVLNSSEEAKTA
jgi:hypothetical protein